MKIPNLIHQIWLGGPMPKQIQSWTHTVGVFHPGWSRIIWNEQSLEAIGEDVAPLFEMLGNWASVTNLLRLKLLMRFGGWYLDTDFEAIDSLDSLCGVHGDAVAAMQDKNRICNAFMAAVPNHPWVKWQLDHFATLDPRDAANGVALATMSPHACYILPQHYVYPWMYDSPKDARHPHRDSILIHHWEGSWTK